MKKASIWLFLAGFISATIVGLNQLIFKLATIKDRLNHNRAHYYQWKFGKIFYSVQGNGPAVLLIHNTDSDASAYEFTRIVNTLAKKYSVYTIDLLGYGRSDKPKLTYTAYVFVQLINDFVKDIIREQTTLVTSGKSNAYATMACYQNHDQFKNLIFINPASFEVLKKNPGNWEKLMKFTLELPLLGTTIYNAVHSRRRLQKTYRERIYNTNQVYDQYIEASHESAHLSGSASKFVYASEHCQFNNVKIKEAIAGINNNIYIIQGLRCLDQPKCKCDDYKIINPAIECTTIDRTKSMPHMEKPESVLEILSVYLH